MKWVNMFVVLALAPLALAIYAIGFWGKPISVQVRLLSKVDTNQDGKVDQWALDSTHDGKPDWIEIDSNYDGMVDRLQFGNPEIQTLDLSRDQLGGSQRKKIALCLDGVPYEAMAQLWDEGFFREFCHPVKLISVFPSVSDVALTEVLQSEKVPGYENLYFDWERNAIAGGAASTVSKARIPYLEALDYDEPGIFKGLAYIIPVKTYRADLGRFLKRYSANQAASYTAHICSTDSLCHLMTQSEFLQYLKEVDSLLREIYIQHKGLLDFVVFSDHGNSQVGSQRVNAEEFLSEHGFRVESSIKSEKSVVIPGFGLVGVIAAYSKPENTVRLADLLSRCEGVDFSAYLAEGTVRIVSTRGKASIIVKGDRLKYQIESGDPLKLAAIVNHMKTESFLDSEDFAGSKSWFEAAADHEFPDAVNALYRGMTNHVANRASILVSLKDGYHYGSRFFDQIVTLRSTHGSLRKTSMTGFAMRNSPMPSEIVPARELLKAVNTSVATETR